MASHRMETKKVGDINCNYFSYKSLRVVLHYLSMLSGCELSVATLTLQTQGGILLLTWTEDER